MSAEPFSVPESDPVRLPACRRPRASLSGFTLIELLVVIGEPPPATYSRVAAGGHPAHVREFNTSLLPVLEQGAR